MNYQFYESIIGLSSFVIFFVCLLHLPVLFIISHLASFLLFLLNLINFITIFATITNQTNCSFFSQFQSLNFAEGDDQDYGNVPNSILSKCHV